MKSYQKFLNDRMLTAMENYSVISFRKKITEEETT